MKKLTTTALATFALMAATGATISTASAEDQCLSYNLGNNQLSYCRNNVEPLFPAPQVYAPTVYQPSVVYAQPAPVVVYPGQVAELRKEIRLLRRMDRHAHLSRGERKRINRKISRRLARLEAFNHRGGKRHKRVAYGNRRFDNAYRGR
ncbi:MAG: hypothetical protein O2912_06135 [Proteobacteria bacterium]|nr:hypothetical protein [Pseudomonadota bacterium]